MSLVFGEGLGRAKDSFFTRMHYISLVRIGFSVVLSVCLGSVVLCVDMLNVCYMLCRGNMIIVQINLVARKEYG